MTNDSSAKKKRRATGGNRKPSPSEPEPGRDVPPGPPDIFARAYRGEVNAEALLLETAMALDSLAKRSKSSRDIAVARIVDALWLSTKRNGETVFPSWEREAFQYLEARAEGERWTMLRLPPKAGLDRSDAVTELVGIAKRWLDRASAETTTVPPKTPTVPAEMMARHTKTLAHVMTRAVWNLFPNLCPNPVAESKMNDAEQYVSRWYAKAVNRARGNGRRLSDPEALACAALRAFGVTSGDAQNWIKGIRRAH